MDIRQVLRKRSDGTLVLGFPVWFRVALTVIAVGMIALMISDGRVYPLPLVFAVVTGLGALYTQGWEFNPNNGAIVHRHGLLILAHTVSYDASEVELLVLEQFSPGAAVKKRFLRLKLALRNGEQSVLEIQRQRTSPLADYARTIAAAMSFRLEGDALSGDEPA